MDFDAARFAVAYLAVSNAVGKDKDMPAFRNTIGCYLYEGQGIRLVGSDAYVLAVAWVPELDTDAEAPPILREADEVWVCHDDNGRAKKLMQYVSEQCVEMARQADPEWEGGLPVDLGERIHLHRAKKRQVSQLHLVGMDPPLDTVIDYMGEEHVALVSSDTRFPGWEQMVADRVRSGTPTSALSLTAATLGKVAALGKLIQRATAGAGGNLVCSLDGNGGTVMVQTMDVPGLLTFASSQHGARFLNLDSDDIPVDGEIDGQEVIDLA